MVLNLDMAPTLLEIAGLAAPAEMQGRSFLSLAEGKRDTSWRKDWLYGYSEDPGFENVPPCRGVRTKRYKFIHFFLDPEEFELYDLETDPDEKNNLFGKPGYAEITAHLKERLAALRTETNDTYRQKPTGIPKHMDLGSLSESSLTHRQQ